MDDSNWFACMVILVISFLSLGLMLNLQIRIGAVEEQLTAISEAVVEAEQVVKVCIVEDAE